MSEKKIDHEFTPEIVCPYCGHACSDSWDYRVGSGENIECPSEECGKTFFAEEYVTVEYITARPEDRTPEGRARKIAEAQAASEARQRELDELLGLPRAPDGGVK